MRLDGPQGRSGQAENLVPTGIRSRTVEPVVSHYTDWATRPTAICVLVSIYYYSNFFKFVVVDYYLFVIVNLYMGRNGTHVCCYIAMKCPNEVDVHQGMPVATELSVSHTMRVEHCFKVNKSKFLSFLLGSGRTRLCRKWLVARPVILLTKCVRLIQSLDFQVTLERASNELDRN